MDVPSTAGSPPVIAALRAEIIGLLARGGDRDTIAPSVYDRFESWWYGAAPNSRRAFAADIRAWRDFRDRRAQPMLPAGALDVRDFVRARFQAGLRSSSIARALASVATLHRLMGADALPLRDPLVTAEMRGLRREEGHRGRGRAAQALGLRERGDVADMRGDAPLPFSVLGLLSTLDLSQPAQLRDAVLLALGTDLGRRRSEYSALDVGDVRFDRDGSGTVLIRRSKTDQAAEGSVKFVSTRSIALIRQWLAVRGTPAPDAPLLTSVDRFGRIGPRLSGDGVGNVLRSIARRGLAALLPGAAPADLAAQIRGLSGHSFRVGFAQDLTALGEGTAAICQAADWKSPAMPARYAEALAAKSGAVARWKR